MSRWILAVAVAFTAVLAGAAPALEEDKETKDLREKILKKVEERLKEENKRVLEEVKRILDEELSKLGEEQPEPKKEPKAEPKKDPKKEPKKEPKPSDEPGYMGVYPEDLSDGMRELLKLKESEGVLIVGLAEDGPAAKAGMKENDIVLEVDGEKVGSMEELREAVTSHTAGETVEIVVLRKKEKKTLKVKLASRDELEAQPEEEGEEEGSMEEGEGEEEDEKPAKKPKVVFEPRAEAPKYDAKTAEELRDEIRKFLDEALKKEAPKAGKPKTKKTLLPKGSFFAGGEDEEEPAEGPGSELRELTKKFLKDLLQSLEEGEEEGEEDAEEPFGFDEELRRMMERFREFRGEEFQKLREKLAEELEKLQDPEFLEKMLEGLNGQNLEDQLRRMLEGAGREEDEEDLTEPEEAPAPKAVPGKGSRVWLGIGPEALGEDLKKQLKIASGVVVRDVHDGSPASEAGLKEGDVILEMDGKAVESPADLQSALATRKVGAQATLKILRKGKTIEKTVTLVARKKISVPAKPSGTDWYCGDGKKKEKSKKKEPRVEKKTLTLVIEDEDDERGVWVLGEGDDEDAPRLFKGRALKPLETGKLYDRFIPRDQPLYKRPLANLLLEDGKEKDKRPAKKGRQVDGCPHCKEGECPFERLLDQHRRGRDFEFNFRNLERDGQSLQKRVEEGRRRVERALTGGKGLEGKLRKLVEGRDGRYFHFDFEDMEKGQKELRKRLEEGRKQLEKRFEEGRKRYEKALKDRKGAERVFRRVIELEPKETEKKSAGPGLDKEMKKALEKAKEKAKEAYENLKKPQPRPKFQKAEPPRKGDLEGTMKEFEKLRREMEKALEEMYEQDMPDELRRELEKLHRELRKMMEKKEKKGSMVI